MQPTILYGEQTDSSPVNTRSRSRSRGRSGRCECEESLEKSPSLKDADAPAASESESDSESSVKDTCKEDIDALIEKYKDKSPPKMKEGWEVVWKLDLSGPGDYGAMYIWNNIGRKEALQYCMMHPEGRVSFYEDDYDEAEAWASACRLEVAGDWRELINEDSDYDRAKNSEITYWEDNDIIEIPETIPAFSVRDYTPCYDK